MTNMCLVPHPYEINKTYFIRTVTYFFTGILVGIYDKELVLDNVSWVADTGRYGESFITGKHAETEIVPGRVIINRECIIDVSEWDHKLC